MRTWGRWRADGAAAREYRAALEQIDQGLAALEASGQGPGTVVYEQAWHDRMGFAANPAGRAGVCSRSRRASSTCTVPSRRHTRLRAPRRTRQRWPSGSRPRPRSWPRWTAKACPRRRRDSEHPGRAPGRNSPGNPGDRRPASPPGRLRPSLSSQGRSSRRRGLWSTSCICPEPRHTSASPARPDPNRRRDSDPGADPSAPGAGPGEQGPGPREVCRAEPWRGPELAPTAAAS